MQTLYHKSRRNATAEFLAILWGRAGTKGLADADLAKSPAATGVIPPFCCGSNPFVGFEPRNISGTKIKRPFRAFFIITGGDEGIRTLDTVAGILHFQCSALDQLCDVSVSVGQIIQQTNPLCFPSVVGQQVRQPMRFPILHQFHATMDLRLRQPLMILRLLRPQGYLCMTE